ncbi:hypothetical protein CDL15_Pgr022477 [Punica granatum]|uniref:Uncharacterized protein n=1 Tax=Punica granatum TaxID=22663 RepID=A0A218XRS3_PUNGR|nr:hypothetical protein CDL15_Pgr022477 [Punica granatum]
MGMAIWRRSDEVVISKTRLVLVLLVFALCLVFCSVKEVEAARTTLVRRISVEDYSHPGGGAGAGDDDDGYGIPDYDFYRKHGEVPSPGMGH